MSLGYFDTSALMRWGEKQVSSPRSINVELGSEVEQLIADPAIDLTLSEITLLEFRANVARAYRSQEDQFATCDGAWAQQVRLSLMQLVAAGQMGVISVPPRAAEQAIALVDLAADKGAGGLGIWDAMHLLSAARWAHESGQIVQLYTSDPDYGEFYVVYSDFGRFVEIVKLQDLAASRKAGASAP